MKKETSILTPDEITQEFFRLPGAAFEIHGAQDGNNILQQKLGIVCPASFKPLGPGPGNLLGYALLFLRLRV